MRQHLAICTSVASKNASVQRVKTTVKTPLLCNRGIEFHSGAGGRTDDSHKSMNDINLRLLSESIVYKLAGCNNDRRVG